MQSHFYSDDNGPRFPSLSLSLSTWWLYCVARNDEKSRQEWGATAEKRTLRTLENQFVVQVWMKMGWKWLCWMFRLRCGANNVLQFATLAAALLLTFTLEQTPVLFCDFWIQPAIMKVWTVASDGRLLSGYIFTHLHNQSGKELETFNSTVRFNSSFGHLFLSLLQVESLQLLSVWCDQMCCCCFWLNKENHCFSSGPFLINWSLLNPQCLSLLPPARRCCYFLYPVLSEFIAFNFSEW